MRSVVGSSVWQRYVVSLALIGAAGVAIATNTSCVLLDGPADLPVPPIRRPTILRSEVLPPATGPIGALLPNGEFDVPIEIPDPTQSVTWAAFLDYGQESEFLIGSENVFGSTNAPDITTVSFDLPPPRVQGSQCHTIHFVVALSTAFSNQLHDTDPTLSDTVDWYFVPGGNPGGCSTYDGGANDGAFPFTDGEILDDSGDGNAD